MFRDYIIIGIISIIVILLLSINRSSSINVDQTGGKGATTPQPLKNKTYTFYIYNEENQSFEYRDNVSKIKTLIESDPVLNPLIEVWNLSCPTSTTCCRIHTLTHNASSTNRYIDSTASGTYPKINPNYVIAWLRQQINTPIIFNISIVCRTDSVASQVNDLRTMWSELIGYYNKNPSLTKHTLLFDTFDNGTCTKSNYSTTRCQALIGSNLAVYLNDRDYYSPPLTGQTRAQIMTNITNWLSPKIH